MSIFLDIESALQTRLLSIAGHPKIQWENDDVYQPVADTRYWRPSNIPARSELVNANALQKHQGIFQVDVFIASETGLAQLMEDLDAIYEAFNSVNSLSANDTKVHILSVGRGRVEREENWVNGFIEIYYMCYSH